MHSFNTNVDQDSYTQIGLVLSKFSFAACGMRHEEKDNVDLAVVNCSLSREGLNLACAHSGFENKPHDKRFLQAVAFRLASDRLISEEEAEVLMKKIVVLDSQLYVLDVLKRNSTPQRMNLYPNWKNSECRKPRNDRLEYEFLIKRLDPISPLRKLLEKLYQSFEVRKDHNHKNITYIQDIELFNSRLKIAQILVGADALAVARHLLKLCKANESADLTS